MIRRNNKVGVAVSNVASPRKKETKSTSDEKSPPKRPLPPAPKRKAKKMPNPNCKECINKVHSPRKLKARLSAKIEAIRHEDALDVADVAEASQREEKETCMSVSCGGMVGNGDLEGDKLDDVDLKYDDDKDIVCGGKANYGERDQHIDAGEQEVNGDDGDGKEDDDDDIVCGGTIHTPIGDKNIDVSEQEQNGNGGNVDGSDNDDDDDDIILANTDTGEISDASHDENDDVVCGRDSKSVDQKTIGQNDTREDEAMTSLEQGEHHDDDDVVCGTATPCTGTPKNEVMKSMEQDGHDDDDDIVCGTPVPCIDSPMYEADTQSQANEEDMSSFTEVSDVSSSDDELDWDSCSTTVSDNEDTSSDTISECSDIVAGLAGEYTGLEMSKTHEQDGGLKDASIGEDHDDGNDVICDDQSKGSKVQTIDIKREQESDGEPEGDVECHGDEVTGDGKGDIKDKTCGDHSTEDKDQVLNATELRSSVVEVQEIHGQRSVRLDKCSALTGTDSSEKKSYAELILNLASVIGDMKASGSSYESRARLIGQMMSGKKTVDISETKENGQIATKEVGSHNMAGDMKIQSSDEATASSELHKSPLVRKKSDDFQEVWYTRKSKKTSELETAKEPSQSKPYQKTMDDPLDDIDQLLDEASNLF